MTTTITTGTCEKCGTSARVLWQSRWCMPCAPMSGDSLAVVSQRLAVEIREMHDATGIDLACWPTAREFITIVSDPIVRQVTADDLLDALADILYPVDGDPDDQWNGGDVCEDLNRLLLTHRPDAPSRQVGTGATS